MLLLTVYSTGKITADQAKWNAIPKVWTPETDPRGVALCESDDLVSKGLYIRRTYKDLDPAKVIRMSLIKPSAGKLPTEL